MSRALCPLPGAATFCNLNVGNFCATGNAQINGNLNVNGIITGNDGLGYGNTLIVDSVDGNDATGAVNGPRFKTIGAACAQANPGSVIWVFPGQYNESITVPAFVTLAGIAPGNVVIQQLNVTQDTDLVTLSEGANINNVSLVLASQMHVQLRGLVFPPTSLNAALNCAARTVGIVVNNAGAGAGTSDVYGVNFSGPGTTTNVDNSGLGHNVVACSVLVNSIGSGKKRGGLVDTENSVNFLACRVHVEGGTDVIAVETSDPGAIAILDGSIIGGDTSDISQVAGDLNLLASSLENATANNLGFDTLVKASSFIFADTDSPIGAFPTPIWLRPGSAPGSAVPLTIPASQHFLAKSLTVRAIEPPGLGSSTTFTVCRQTPSDLMPQPTALTVTLTDMQTDATINTVSVHFDAFDLMAVEAQDTSGAQTGDVLASINIY